MPLDECISKHTHRQYRTWLAWLDDEWNRPTRSDFYLMQIAAEVRKVLAKNRKKIKVEHFWFPRTFWDKLFKRKPATDPQEEQVSPAKAMTSKAFWFGLVGLGKKKPEQNISE